jgi:quinol monooxygenase YgiN
MWTQIIKTQIAPGKDAEIVALMDEFKAMEQPDSGLVSSAAMRDRSDPSSVYVVVTFESEEKARAREQDPRRAEALGPAQELMGKLFEAPPEFIDLDVVAAYSGA